MIAYASAEFPERSGEERVNERARTLVTLVLTVLIVLASVMSMSMVFVAASGLAALVIYVSTDDVVAGLAVGLVVGLVAMLGLDLLVPELLVAAPDDRPRTHEG